MANIDIKRPQQSSSAQFSQKKSQVEVLPKIQNFAPDFSVPAVYKNNLKNISLSEYRGKYVVLIFYPMDFSFVCPTEIISFSDRAQEFRNLGCEILASSCETQHVHLAWINTPRRSGGLGEVDIPLLADKTMKVARDYGILDDSTGNCFRGLFIIDPHGYIRQITINDLSVGRSVDETLRLVQAIQFTDEFGEVCPANWRPGFKSIKPDNVEKLEYFKNAI